MITGPKWQHPLNDKEVYFVFCKEDPLQPIFYYLLTCETRIKCLFEAFENWTKKLTIPILPFKTFYNFEIEKVTKSR